MTSAKNSPAKTEAIGETTVTFTVEIQGKEVELTAPASIDLAPMDAALAFEEEKYLKAFSIILGPVQMDHLRRAGATTSDYSEKVMSAWNEVTGLGEG